MVHKYSIKLMQQVEIPLPEKFLLTSTHDQSFGDSKYTYFIAEKNNERLFGRHKRFFILKQDFKTQLKQFGYGKVIEKGQKVPFPTEEEIPKRKITFLFDNLQDLKFNNKQSVEVIFNHSGKKITWEITFQNQRMAENIYNLLQNARTAIQNVIHNDLVNQTSNVIFPPPQAKKNQKPNQKNMEGNPFASDLNKNPSENKEIPTNVVANSLQSLLAQNQKTFPKQQAPSNSQTVNLRSLTFAPDDNKINQIKAQQPITKISLLNLSEQNLKEKQKFINNMEDHKFKEEGILSSKLGSLPVSLSHQKQSMATLTEDLRKTQLQSLLKREQVINNQNQQWDYLFLKGNQQNLIEDFKKYSQNIASELIDSLILPRESRTYNPEKQTSTYDEYEIDNLRIRLCYTAMAQIRLLKNSKESIYDEKQLKAALRQFKNMNYLLSVTRNKGKIRLPLANIVEYKGIVAFVRTLIIQDDRQAVNLSNQLKLISKQARIRKDIFADPRSIKIKPLQSKAFEKFNREQSPLKKSQRLFQYYYLDEVKHFLPADMNFAQKDPENSIIRSELLQHEELDGGQLMGFNIQPFLNRSKTDKNVQQAFRELQSVSKNIIQAVDNLIQEWQGMDVITLTSNEVEKLFHSHGVNMRYLGMVYDKSSVGLVRKICMSEISARAAKIILRATLQDFIRSYPDSLTPQQKSKKDKITYICQCNIQLTEIVIRFLNNITSESSESQDYWRSLNKQSQHNFNVSLSKQEISQPYFIQALVNHFNINFDWDKLSSNRTLFKGKLFRRDMIKGFNVKSKNYNLDFTDLYVRINLLIQEGTPESAEQIKSILNLRKADIPQHFKLNGTFNKLALFISTYVEPKHEDTLNHTMPCTSIYDLITLTPPTCTSICLGLTEIKWILKADKVEKAQKLLKEMTSRISQWCGEIHPTFTPLYSMFAQYHLLKGEFETAMNYSRSALANQNKILGQNHQKIAERYFEQAQIGFKASKKQDSLANYRKAKNVCDSISQTDNIHYAEICYKISVLCLELNKLQQAEATCRSAVEIFEMNRGQQNPNNEEAEKYSIQCYELLMRIYEVWGKIQEMQKISFYCGESLEDFTSVTNMEKVLRVYLIPYFLGTKNKQAQKMVLLFKQIPLQSGASLYTSAYSHIRKLIQNQRLLQTIEHLFDNFNEVYDQITENFVLTRWRGFEAQGKSLSQQCISLVEALIYFLGEGFVIGGLSEK